ncbi:MAG: gamma-glutamylcyclotransferase [Burkholderiales bacterium]|jgi:gamma-glutamylcyclotransferase (GGCT)/AIG2-like uncharacterized protein YtfP
MRADLPCFAYGSNLCAAELESWLVGRGLDAGHVRPIGPALLPDHALSFGYFSLRRRAGALDVRPRRGSVVQGALFEASPEGWAALDEKEGVATGAYARREVELVLPDGRLTRAITYVVTESRRCAHQVPASDYVATVLRGYDRFGHDPAPLHAAAGGAAGAFDVDAVFVYGTLLRGESNAHVLHGQPLRRVAPARVAGSLHETGSPYPVMVLDPAHRVVGEVAQPVDIEAALGPLDALEDFGGYGRDDRLYHRTLIRAEEADGGATRLCWTYVAGETIPLGPRIADGDWRRFRAGILHPR